MATGKLANGAEVISFGPIRQDGTRVVLAEYNKMYVTWRAVCRPDSDVYDCYWGNYHSNLYKAVDCFVERVHS